MGLEKFYFLRGILKDEKIYEDILVALQEQRMEMDELYEHLTEDLGHSYAKRTVREKLKELQNFNLVAKEYEGHAVFYVIPEWNQFKSNTLDPLRNKTRRNVFKEVEYRDG